MSLVGGLIMLLRVWQEIKTANLGLFISRKSCCFVVIQCVAHLYSWIPDKPSCLYFQSRNPDIHLKTTSQVILYLKLPHTVCIVDPKRTKQKNNCHQQFSSKCKEVRESVSTRFSLDFNVQVFLSVKPPSVLTFQRYSNAISNSPIMVNKKCFPMSLIR